LKEKEVLIEKTHVDDPRPETSMNKLLDKLVGTVNVPPKKDNKPIVINLFEEEKKNKLNLKPEQNKSVQSEAKRTLVVQKSRSGL
jgi:hypothetical protein